MEGNSKAVMEALKASGLEVLSGKGGFFVRGGAFISLAQARKRTGITAPARKLRGTQQAWGEWGWVAAINRVKG